MRTWHIDQNEPESEAGKCPEHLGRDKIAPSSASPDEKPARRARKDGEKPKKTPKHRIKINSKKYENNLALLI